MPDFFFLFLVPAYGGSTFYYRVNICLALSPNYKRDKQSRVFADQSSKVKRKKRETPKKKKRTRNRESNRSGVEMHSLNAMLNKKKEKKKKKKIDRNDRTCRVLFPSRYTRVASSHGWVFSM